MRQDNEGELDPGFRIVDKRRSGAEQSKEPNEGEGQPAPTAEPTAPGAQPGAARAEAAGDQPPEGEEAQLPLEPVDVFGVVEYCISVLNAYAWQSMGLVINPITKRAERDLPQARIAIDCVESLFRRIEPELPADLARKLRQVVADLQVNFVRQSQRTQ